MNSIILYRNIFTTTGATVTARDTTTGYNVSNVYDYKAYTSWRAQPASDHLIQWIEVALPEEEVDAAATGLPIDTAGGGDLLSAASGPGEYTPDTIGIFNHNLGSLGITVTLQRWNTFTSAWVDILDLTPTTDKTILRTFTTVNANKYRLYMVCPAAGINIRISQIYLGQRLEFPFRPEGPVVPISEAIELKAETSKAGYILGALVAHWPFTLSHLWKYLTRAWYRDYFLPFWDDHAKYLKPFFYAWDLDERPDDVYFVSVDPGMVRREPLSILTYSDELQLQMRSIGN